MIGVDKVTQRLKEFAEQTEGVRGVVVSTLEGLPFAYHSTTAFDPDLISAVISSIFLLARKSGKSSELGDPKEITIHLEDGSLYIFPLGELVLGILTLPGAMTGMVLVSARKMLGDIAKMDL